MLDRATKVSAIRRQIQSGEYPMIVTERMVDLVLDDVLREEMQRGGESIPPVVTGQGDYVRYWPDCDEPGPLVPGTCDRQRERAESSCIGSALVAGVLIGVSFLAACFWGAWR